MNVFEQIALGWGCVIATARRMLQPALWVPWLLLGAAQFLTLLLIAGFAHPLVSAVMAPFVSLLGGAEVRHYPEVFRQLPELHAQAVLIVDVLLAPIAAGAAVTLLAAAYDRGRAAPGTALGSALRRTGALVIAMLPYALLVAAITFGAQAWLHGRGSAGLTRKLAQLAGLGGSVFLRAAFLYVTPLVMLAGLGPAAAWRDLPRLIGRSGITALTIVVLAAIVTAPFAMLARFAPRLVESGMPEAVVGLVAVQIVGGMIAGFLITGGAVLVWQSVEIDVEAGW